MFVELVSNQGSKDKLFLFTCVVVDWKHVFPSIVGPVNTCLSVRSCLCLNRCGEHLHHFLGSYITAEVTIEDGSYCRSQLC